MSTLDARDEGPARTAAQWRPAPLETGLEVTAWSAAAFSALLDQPVPDLRPGSPLPPLWHVLQAPEHPTTHELGDDGHPRDGHFLPPLPDRRRMFAGGRVEVRAPLRIGESVVRRTELLGVRPTTGRSGDLLFVTLRTTYRVADELRVVDEQDLVYRSGGPDGGTRRSRSGADEPTAPVGEPWQLRLHPDPVLLFRFSALTYNAHRIHYDLPYATEVEGHPGLLVHGPLLALLLLELPRRFAPDRAVTAFEYRLRRPAVAGVPLVAAGSPDGLRAGVPDGPPSIVGRARLDEGGGR
jgi:3-methylfumaryl-CoA hydratase